MLNGSFKKVFLMILINSFYRFSYSVVQFTLYHIYSGTNEIPDSIDLIELTSLTDVLGLEGLREIISNTIKAKFAHNFHRVRF